MSEPLLNTNELAAALRRSRTYVWAMKARGFQMPGGAATLSEARAWLILHPHPRAKNESAEHGGTPRNIETIETSAGVCNVVTCPSAPQTSERFSA